MSVGELIRLLEKLNEDMPVMITRHDGKEPEIEGVCVKKDKTAGVVCAELIYRNDT